MLAAIPISGTRLTLGALITRLVELKESADTIARFGLVRDPNGLLLETRKLLDGVAGALPLGDRLDASLCTPGLIRAQALAMRELTAARRHQDLAGKSEGARQAACELALRSLVRAIDIWLPELVPHSIAPKR
jgi:hypothetical protein